MELDMLWRIIDEGSTPAIVLIAYFLWKVDRRLETFIVEIKALAKSRDEKLKSIHSDIGAMIRKIAGMKNGGSNEN